MSARAIQFMSSLDPSKSKVMNSYANLGTLVQVDPTDETQWVKAEGTNASQVWFLEREVVAQDIELALKAEKFGTEVGKPVSYLGDQASARMPREIQVEGDDLLHSNMSGASVGDEVSAQTGKIGVIQSGHERLGVINAIVAAKITGNTYRYVIDIKPSK